MMKLPNFRPSPERFRGLPDRPTTGPSRFSIGKGWHRARKQAAAGVLAATCFAVFGVPPAAAFRERRDARRGDAGKTAPAPPRPDARRLTDTEMRTLRGAGAKRNQAFCGAMPWHKSFRNVNMCTGNLFLSATDIQVAPARGAGLAWQRSYNSNDDRVGPFGVGWTHAYDIRMEEAGNNLVPRVDFFGGSHYYTRDADGLYTPPPYMFDELDSNYDLFLVNGPAVVLEDTQHGKDGSVKHFFANVDERACDWLEDRHGNRTTLTYGLTLSTGKKLLTRVTDPSGRYLDVSWTNLGTVPAPAYRITQVAGPIDPNTSLPVYTTSYEYDGSYNLWKAHQDPAGLNRVTTYNYTTVAGESSLVNSITDPTGQVVTYGYTDRPDLTGTVWVSSVIEPTGGGTVTWNLNATPGGLFSGLENYASTSAGGGFTGARVVCDPNLRCAAMGLTAAGGQPAISYSWTYDSNNNVISETGLAPRPTAAGGSATHPNTVLYRTFGPHGNVLTEYLLGLTGTTVTTTYYDASKYFQKASVTDALGIVTNFDYFANNDASVGNRGEVKWVRDARYGVTGEQYEYTYNSYGQKLTETNLRNVVTQYTYGDTWKNLTQVVQDPGAGHLNRTSTMTYDVAGRVTASTDPKSQSSSFAYNAAGQPTTATLPGETITYGYDSAGRSTTVADGRGTTTIAYQTGTSRVASVTDPITGTITYGYSPTGERTSVAMPGGNTWTYQYWTNWYCAPKGTPDSVGRMLQSITDDQGRVVKYFLDTRGRLFEVERPLTSGKLNTSYTYDTYTISSVNYSQGRLTQVLNQKAVPFMGGTIYTTLVQNDYTYDDVGNRLTNGISDNTGLIRTESYGYDALNRLTSVNYGDGGTQSYTFDAQGNRLTKVNNGVSESYVYDLANRLTSRGGSAYTNDANGNILTGGGRTNTWDGRNRLTTCVFNGTTTNHTYGADGLRRRTAITGGATTDFVLEGQSVVRELRSGSAYATYLTGPRGPEYRRDSGGNVAWYVTDGLGSVLAEVNAGGTVTATRKVDVYGAERATTGTATSTHKFVGNLGHPSEGETGLIYMRARYYDPVTGRFVSEDPAGDGHNWYAYGSNSPTNSVDVSGRSTEWINHVFHGPDWFMQGLWDAAGQGREAFIEYLEEHWNIARMSITAGTAPGVAGTLQLRLLVRSLLLEELVSSEAEIGVGEFMTVDADLIGTLIEGAVEGSVLDMETGAVIGI